MIFFLKFTLSCFPINFILTCGSCFLNILRGLFSLLTITSIIYAYVWGFILNLESRTIVIVWVYIPFSILLSFLDPLILRILDKPPCYVRQCLLVFKIVLDFFICLGFICAVFLYMLH